MMRFEPSQLTGFCEALLISSGIPGAHAHVTATRLVEADLRGRTGHGVIRLGPYIERIDAGGINRNPVIRVLHETPVSAQLDGDNGLGQVVMTQATEIGIIKAKESGLAWVGTVHSNHAGAAGLYPQLAADAGLIGIYFAVANANGMPPWGGNSPILGTNPLAIAIPTASGKPFLLDIATTVASHGTIKVARRAGEKMPEGWVVDGRGNPITDPERAEEGFLVPIGGYKGSGLNIAIGLLAGVLNGAAFGRDVIDHRVDLFTPTNTGQSMLVMRPDLFGDATVMLDELERHLNELRHSGSHDGSPLRLPGDTAARVLSDNLVAGVALPADLVTELDALALSLSVKPLSEAAR